MEQSYRGSVPSLFLGFDFKLVIDFIFARNVPSLGADRVLLLLAIDGPLQGYFAILGDDLDVFRVHRQGAILDDGLSDFLSQPRSSLLLDCFSAVSVFSDTTLFCSEELRVVLSALSEGPAARVWPAPAGLQMQMSDEGLRQLIS